MLDPAAAECFGWRYSCRGICFVSVLLSRALFEDFRFQMGKNAAVSHNSLARKKTNSIASCSWHSNTMMMGIPLLDDVGTCLSPCVRAKVTHHVQSVRRWSHILGYLLYDPNSHIKC